MARQVLENGVVLPAEYSDDWYDDMTSNLTKLDDVIGSDSEKLSSADVGAAALSNSYNDLDNLPTIPTKTSDLTNDSNFVDTSNSAVASGITSAKVTSYDAHIEDTNIHVTAADKSKWNNGVSQSYVLRYSSASVTDNSTVSYSTLDNTDNIKSDDKVIDVDGKIFSVVSVDTANQTVTVGSALIDLALDSNVVHTSGNETISGQKTFSVTPYIYNADDTGNTPYLNFKSSKAVKGDAGGSNTDSAKISHLDKNNNQLSYIQFKKSTNGGEDISFYCSTIDADNQVIDSAVSFYKLVNGSSAFRSVRDNEVSSGDSSSKWKDVNTYLINGLNPGILSLPSQSYVDISSYFTNTGTGEFNNYTASSDGWIFLRLGTISSCQAQVLDSNDNILWGTSSSGTVEMLTIPILSGCKLQTQWATGSTVNVATARFYPCLGNV